MNEKKRKKLPLEKISICPSLLAADFARLTDELKRLEAEAEILHLDIMDGHFVPNISFGPALIKKIRPFFSGIFDVHLMCSEPERWFEAFADAGADLLVFHVEASRHAPRLLSQIRELGLLAGVAVNPGTPLAMVEELLPWTDLLLLMTVNPGFGGQAFLSQQLDKISRARAMTEGREILLQVDGGITVETVGAAASAGARALVAGSSIFAKENPAEALRELRRLAQAAVNAD